MVPGNERYGTLLFTEKTFASYYTTDKSMKVFNATVVTHTVHFLIFNTLSNKCTQ